MKKNTNLNYPKLQNRDETTLKHCISPALKTPKGIYRHQGKGGPGENPGPKYGRARRPRKHGKSRVFVAFLEPRAVLRAARCPVCPVSASALSFWFSAPGFDKTTPQGQWLYYRPLITH